MSSGVVSDSLQWNGYLQATIDRSSSEEASRRFGTALKNQRELMDSLVRELNPQRVGCLGSGYLNDIPIETLLTSQRTCYFVDWVPGISVEGLRGNIIADDGQGFACIFCHAKSPEKYCRAFCRTGRNESSVCDAFCLSQGNLPRCENYFPGAEPRFITHDVTMGKATDFAKGMQKILPSCRSPQQAFGKAISECRRCESIHQQIPIPDGSLDFVTSSMLVSQFEHEPYTFFARLLEDRFGRDEILKHEEKLIPCMEKLRSELFRIQIEGHAKELYRLVERKRGKVYFSVELFRSLPSAESYFLVQEIPLAMEVLGRFFYFDFQQIRPEKTLNTIAIGAGTSIVERYLLTPRPHPTG